MFTHLLSKMLLTGSLCLLSLALLGLSSQMPVWGLKLPTAGSDAQSAPYDDGLLTPIKELSALSSYNFSFVDRLRYVPAVVGTLSMSFVFMPARLFLTLYLVLNTTMKFEWMKTYRIENIPRHFSASCYEK